MNRINVGDIVSLKESGIRRIVIEERDEIFQNNEDFRLRIAYKVAGKEYSDRWFYKAEIENISPKKQ